MENDNCQGIRHSRIRDDAYSGVHACFGTNKGRASTNKHLIEAGVGYYRQSWSDEMGLACFQCKGKGHQAEGFSLA